MSSLQELLDRRTMPAAAELSPQDGERILCLACGHRCRVGEGRRGTCRVRFVKDGVLRVPGEYVAGLAIDPIEKKPFYHVLPGSNALSFGMLGCDLHCGYCQNWDTSQSLRDRSAQAQPRNMSAREIVQAIASADCKVVVSTYNEPLITAEWSRKVFELAKENNFYTGYVSNGNATQEVLDYLRPVTDLYKIDLKSFNDRSYRSLGCPLSNVLRGIEMVHERAFWLEIVTLVVPGFNDSSEELSEIAKFIVGISREIPWHVTAFHPDYKMTGPRNTEAECLRRARDIGREIGLDYVYVGNCHGVLEDVENTRCAGCNSLLIERSGFNATIHALDAGACRHCGRTLPGIFD